MSEHMVRKQIYLPRRQNLTLKRLAKQRGISEAEVIRQALEREAELSVSTVQGSRQALNNIIVYARSLRKRPELLQGKPYVFNREQVYEERQNRWSERKRG
jgi:arsenate reductase-like glutaredoxin family protein